MAKQQPNKILLREWRIQNLYPIRKEDRTLGRLDLDYFPVQRVLFEYARSLNFRGIRAIVPKSRKMGISTYWLVYYLDDTMFTENTISGIVVHRDQDRAKFFNIVKLAYSRCPNEVELEDGRVWIKPKASYDNKNELRFDDINSGIYVALESRGETNNNLHISEAAHIKDPNRIKASLGSVPNITLGSNITIESTANGVGDWFHQNCIAAEARQSGFKLFFFPWFQADKHAIPPPPGFKLNEEEQEMKQRVKEVYNTELSNAQVFWRRQMESEQGNLVDQEYPTFLDQAFINTGRPAFNAKAIEKIQTKEPLRTMEIKIASPQGDLYFQVRIWQEPKKGRRYVVAGDPSEGTGNDNSAIEVFDRLTLEQVAEFTSDRVLPWDFGILLVEVAKFFNEALLVIERNNHGYTTIESAKRIYSNLYFTTVLDEATNKKTKKLGWLTNSHTRDLMLDDFDRLLRDLSIKINSVILKEECRTFITNEDGKREAKSGKYDDAIMASAIAVTVARLPESTFDLFMLG